MSLFRQTRSKTATAPAATKRPVTAELMRAVRRIEIATKKLVDEGVAGSYHSVFKGRGVEFSEVRPYQPGDPIRSIDWNVTARMGDLFVKQFVEERDLTVFLIVDISGSLNFGSRAILKRELAAEIAALLAFSALRNQDRVGAALVSDHLELFLAPQRRRSHVLRLVREILAHPSTGGTDLDRSVTAAIRNLKQRSVLFLISDFIATPFTGALKAAAARHDLIVVEIADPNDLSLPVTGPVVLRDAENGRVGVVRSKRLLREFGRRRAAERDELRHWTKRLGADWIELRTHRPYLPPLVSFFERRRKRFQR
ncbi:MAG: DUF58 domain-containing protein [Acidobacteriota bacterium]|nr:DUF58 domain-containing protein [Acidobacteriota bacterium]